MKKLLKNLIFFLADILGINKFFKAKDKDKIRILMYHGVTEKDWASPYWTQLYKSKFMRQMQYLSQNYNSISSDDLLNDKVIENRFLVTFDDGLKNVYDNVRSVLEDFNIYAICFVLPELSQNDESIWPDRVYEIFMHAKESAIDLTDFGLSKFELGNMSSVKKALTISEFNSMLKSQSHDKRRKILDHIYDKYAVNSEHKINDFELMSLEDVKEISQSDYFDIGPHTNTHPILSTMTFAQQADEINGCIDKLKANNIDFKPIFAYPNGRKQDYNEDSISVLKNNGTALALTTIDGHYSAEENKKFEIKRILIGADTGFYEFKARMSGFFYFLRS